MKCRIALTGLGDNLVYFPIAVGFRRDSGFRMFEDFVFMFYRDNMERMNTR